MLGRGKETFRIFLSNIHVDSTGDDINTIYDECFTKVLQGYNKAFPIENCYVPALAPQVDVLLY